MALKLTAELGMDGSGFKRGLASASAGLNSIKNQLAAAFSVGAITSIAKKTLEYADNIDEMSSRIGVSTNKLQEWSFAAKQAGADTEKLVSFIEKLSMYAADSKNLSAFAALGINPQGMTPESLFSAVAARTQGKGATEIQSILQSLGFGFKDIGRMVNVLSSDLGQASEDAHRFGAVMDQQTLQTLAKLNDQLSILGQITATQLGPAFIKIAEIAMRAGSLVGGLAAYAGAKTAGLSAGDMAKQIIPWYGFYQMYKNYKTVTSGESAASFDQTAQKEFADKILAMDELLKALQSPTVKPLPVITVDDSAKRTKAIKGAGPYSDSLLAVGNFLGASTRGGIESIARSQLREAQQTNRTLSSIEKKIGNGDINVPATTGS